MKTYTTFNRAVKAANGRPIIKVHNTTHDIYIVGNFSTLTEIAVLAPTTAITGSVGKLSSHLYVGQVTVGHLNRLGNANHAERPANSNCGPWPLNWDVIDAAKQ